MRRLAPVLALALFAAVPAFAQKDPVDPPQQPQQQQPQQPGQARGQNAVSPQGWRREVAQTGTVYFYCASNSCSEGDVVSYRVQPDGQRWSLDQFRQQQVSANDSMLRDGTLRNVEMSGPRDESHDNAIVYVADKTLTDTNGRITGMVSSYLAFGSNHLTLVSTAASISQAGDNVAPFREQLIAWLRSGAR